MGCSHSQSSQHHNTSIFFTPNFPMDFPMDFQHFDGRRASTFLFGLRVRSLWTILKGTKQVTRPQNIRRWISNNRWI